MPDPGGTLVREPLVTFEWHPGFSISQKRLSISALHAAARDRLKASPLLEISTKSARPLGVRLSAFNLQLDALGFERPLLLEAAFQGSKVFARTGQHAEIYRMRSGGDIKALVREFEHERVTSFRFEDREWSPEPLTAFYDWLYLRALLDLSARRRHLTGELSSFAGFTDIEFNPKRSLNCQARACALFVALHASGSVGQLVANPEEFVETLDDRGYGQVSAQETLL